MAAYSSSVPQLSYILVSGFTLIPSSLILPCQFSPTFNAHLFHFPVSGPFTSGPFTLFPSQPSLHFRSLHIHTFTSFPSQPSLHFRSLHILPFTTLPSPLAQFTYFTSFTSSPSHPSHPPLNNLFPSHPSHLLLNNLPFTLLVSSHHPLHVLLSHPLLHSLPFTYSPSYPPLHILHILPFTPFTSSP